MLDKTFRIYNGSDSTPVNDYTDDIDWERTELAGAANLGEGAAGTVVIRDPDGLLPDHFGGKFISAHSVSTLTVGSNVIWRGRLATRAQQRGGATVDRALEHTLTMEDANAHLRGIVIHNWARPAETDKARVQALMAAYLSGSPRATTNLNGSNYVSASNTISLPAADNKKYAGRSPFEVLSEIAQITDKEMFVTVDDQLFYDGHDSIAYQSLLRVSDRTSDASSVTYAPVEPSSDAYSRGIISKLRYYYTTDTGDLSGTVSNQLAPSVDYWEESYWDSDAIGATDAATRAGAYLRARELEEITHTLAIGPMDGHQTWKIKPGQTISVKSRALHSGRTAAGAYFGDSFQTRRIRELRWTIPAVDTYIAHLTLERPRRVKGTSTGNKGQMSPVLLGTGSGFHDTFTRTGTTWANSDSGHVWTKTGTTGSATTSGSFGIISGANIFLQEEAGSILELDAAYWRLTHRFMVSSTPTNASDFLDDLTITWNVGNAISVYISWTDPPSPTNPFLKLLGEGSNPQVNHPTFTFTQGEWYWLKWERDMNRSISRVRVWRDIDPEPSNWIINETASLYDFRPDADHRKFRFDVATTNQGSSITTVASDEVHLVSDDTVALVFGEI